MTDSNDWKPIPFDEKMEDGYRYRSELVLNGSSYDTIRYKKKIPGYTPLTEEEKQVNIAAYKKKLHDEHIRNMAAATVLQCDMCQARIGWVDECDLNGSYFYCLQCISEHKATNE